MRDRLFGTDGIRGVANRHPMTADVALRVGRAAGYLFCKEDRPYTILIGKDTRRSCYMIENALTAGLCSMGARVLLTGRGKAIKRFWAGCGPFVRHGACGAHYGAAQRNTKSGTVRRPDCRKSFGHCGIDAPIGVV
ncbi:MAG TPA: hypothetical protein ENN29_11865 [Candidatus Hydrogenedentes bacterium]|nr:hypothetical protein [Candidatus Hydrogenedentota bacterium]